MTNEFRAKRDLGRGVASKSGIIPFWSLCVLGILWGAIQPPTAQASDWEGSVSAAQSAHRQGDFKKAIKGYEAAIEAGLTNGHLFYNLGHAYYRDGQLGQAMSAFLAARRYLPRNPDVHANVKHVNGQIRDRLTVSAPAEGAGGTLSKILGFWVLKVTPREYVWLFTILGLICGGFLLTTVLVEKLKPYRRYAFGAQLVPLVVLVHLVLAQSWAENWGAVVAEEASVRSGPGQGEKALFVLREGAPFLVTARTSSWYRIRVSDGKKGWVSYEEARVLGL